MYHGNVLPSSPECASVWFHAANFRMQILRFKKTSQDVFHLLVGCILGGLTEPAGLAFFLPTCVVPSGITQLGRRWACRREAYHAYKHERVDGWVNALQPLILRNCGGQDVSGSVGLRGC